LTVAVRPVFAWQGSIAGCCHGHAWYRRSFTLPESFRERKVYIEFEAVRQVAEVYLNGQSMTVFERRVERGETLTLGANVENMAIDAANMYIVFVKTVQEK
jgi:hypothetical protein